MQTSAALNSLKTSRGFVMADQQVDRLVGAIAVTRIDVVGQRHRLALQRAVACELAPRRCRHLDKGEAPVPCRLASQEIVDRPHTIEDALGVVEALDANRKLDIGRNAERLL